LYLTLGADPDAHDHTVTALAQIVTQEIAATPL